MWAAIAAGMLSHETVARRQTALCARIQHSAIHSGDRRFTWNGPYLPLENDPMSKPVNDVRASSFDEKYAGVTFSGLMEDAIAQAKEAPEYPAEPLDIRAPHGMS